MDKLGKYGQNMTIWTNFENFDKIGEFGHKKNVANYRRKKQIHRSMINTRATKTLEE